MTTIISFSKNKARVLMILSILFLICLNTFAQRNSYTRISSPIYFGYELSAGVKQQTLRSNLTSLDQRHVTSHGGTIGVKLANTRASLRAHTGMYYSSASFPYDMSTLEAGCTGQFYLLRIHKVKFHSFEPYALVSIGYERSRFFGSILQHDIQNHSVGEDDQMGQIGWMNTSAGAGVEYQLEGDANTFVHLFAEAKYGVASLVNSSNSDFSQTRIQSPVAFRLGVSFGKFR